MKLTPKDWAEFQHYRDRAPTWIKLHKKLLDDFDFQRLPVASKALAPMLWLLASEYDDGTITATMEEIAFRLRMSEADLDVALKPLLVKPFFYLEHIAIVLIAKTERGASPEKEGEREEEGERETSSEPAAPVADQHASPKPKATKKRTAYPVAFEAFWDAYPTDSLMSKKLAFTRWGKLDDADRIAAKDALSAFKDYCRKNPSYRPVHAERYLSQRRFDGFIVEATQPKHDGNRLRGAWGGRAAALVDQIGEAQFAAWFTDSSFKLGPPVVIRVTKSFAAKWINQNYRDVLVRLYGADCRVEHVPPAAKAS